MLYSFLSILLPLYLKSCVLLCNCSFFVFLFFLLFLFFVYFLIVFFGGVVGVRFHRKANIWFHWFWMVTWSGCSLKFDFRITQNQGHDWFTEKVGRQIWKIRGLKKNIKKIHNRERETERERQRQREREREREETDENERVF